MGNNTQVAVRRARMEMGNEMGIEILIWETAVKVE